jgi:hypothetical protein
MEWPARNPNLTPQDLYLWDQLKAVVCAEKSLFAAHLRECIMNM